MNPMNRIHDAICTSSHDSSACHVMTDEFFDALKAYAEEQISRHEQEGEDRYWEGHEFGFELGWQAACEMWGNDPDASPDDEKVEL